MSKLPVVAVVGRMNVGKSTLFNRLAQSVKSMTYNYAGVTRDVLKDRVLWNGREFELVDTGGLGFGRTSLVDEITTQVHEKALAVLKSADAVLFVVDGAAGVMPQDREISHILRTLNKKTLLLVNKSDVGGVTESLGDFYELHHDSLVPISAEHGRGMSDLLETVIAMLPEQGTEKHEEPAYRVVFLGRPNVGKSSLLNALLQQERAIVSDVPGTTREAISERVQFFQESIELTDTPGIRRKSAVDEDLEMLMVKSSFRAVKNADIVVLMIDATQAGIVDQELKLAFYAFTQLYKALILVINKVDLVTDEQAEDLERSFGEYEHLMKKIEVLRISCKTGKNLGRLLPLLQEVWERHSQRLPAEELTQVLMGALDRTPMMHKKQRLEVYHFKQVSSAPITITMRVNVSVWFGPSQIGFFENILRKHYPLIGVPVRFNVYSRK